MTIVPALWIGGLVLWMIAFIVEGMAALRLEKYHPQTVAAFDRSRAPTSRMLRRFIWGRGHLGLSDSRLTQWVWVTRIGRVAGMVCLTAGVILIWTKA